ncbi:MAG TPA: hypothetical protein VNY05_24210 [Candidatus Acidoferrales bacterium]|jgi:hypothetical protein|nr:hypothetical protein [Candidatus Acidoferrales bacterium]
MLIGKIGLDEPIERTVRLKYLFEDLRNQHLTIVRPSAWDDPFENLITRFAYTFRAADGRLQQHFFDLSHYNVFAQCWSHSIESDALWRIYSTVDRDHTGTNSTEAVPWEGVKVRTTSRRLLAALCRSNQDVEADVYLGTVEYTSATNIRDWIKGIVQTDGPNAFPDSVSQAKVLLLKREPFAHEREVRLIFLNARRPLSDQLLRLHLDPNEAFESMMLDPRLADADAAQRTEQLRAAGYWGSITKSDLYEPALFLV